MCLPDCFFKSSKWLTQAVAFCIDKTCTDACLKKSRNEARSRLRPVTTAERLVMVITVSLQKIQRATAAERSPRRGAFSVILKRCMKLDCASCAKRFTRFSLKGKKPLAFHGDQLDAVALLPATIRRGVQDGGFCLPQREPNPSTLWNSTKIFRLSGEVNKVSA
ncbi:UNVERIFIED_CONTAM: expressed protein JLP1 [Hammondia hammondi]|eukprot:XP_008883966.1 expressed protein JLP1 [Hammondia hammondi]